jgi:hypothetical protein
VASVQIVDVIPAHTAELKTNLRYEDALELERLGITPSRALWRGYKDSVYSKACLVDNRVAAIWGVGGNPLSQEGVVWLLTSPEVYKVSSNKFAAIYRSQVKKMLQLFPILYNYVDAEYDTSIRLLRMCGFTVEKPEIFGYNNNLFCKFHIEMVKECADQQ